MTIFGQSGNGNGNGNGKQVFPVDYEAEVSRRLLEASYSNDLKSASECILDPFVDVNFVGAVCLKPTSTDYYQSSSPFHFNADVTPLFLAAHAGNLPLVNKLLSAGADVNQKLFRGFPTTAAVREDHREVFEILLKAGASQPACEEALLEASCHGRASFVELVMGTQLIRPQISVHALVNACCRGFVDVVDALLKCGVDVNANDRVLLHSSKPSLHANVDCTSLVAAVVSRQISVVHLLLQAGARTDIEVRLGAWSWDMSSGEELRVGAGLAEPYPILWCAVEYYEGSGTILNMLLQQISSFDTQHFGRTLLHHAILCGNTGSVKLLLHSGFNIETPVKTTQGAEFRPIHMAARLGLSAIIQCLSEFGCDIDACTDAGDTALMICTKYKWEECVRVLAIAGADFGLVNKAEQSTISIAGSDNWLPSFQQAVLSIIRAGKLPNSSNTSVFSPLMFVAKTGDVLALKALIGHAEIYINKQDAEGFSAAMIAAMEGHVEAFRLLVYAGADVKLKNKFGETVITLSRLSQKCDHFEKVMLEYALEKGNCSTGGFYVLHCAARRGDMDAVKLLSSRGYDVNLPDGDGYTPLMLAAREGHACICEFLISHGAGCDAKNDRGETVISLARKSGVIDSDTVCVILDELARKLVLSGAEVWKHTKAGRGKPHKKVIKMVAVEGVLKWGNSKRRNVICREAEVGPSASFQRGRRMKRDVGEATGLFRVVTTKNKEVHFVCQGGLENAELWVRGIKLVTREAISGQKPKEA